MQRLIKTRFNATCTCAALFLIVSSAINLHLLVLLAYNVKAEFISNRDSSPIAFQVHIRDLSSPLCAREICDQYARKSVMFSREKQMRLVRVVIGECSSWWLSRESERYDGEFSYGFFFLANMNSPFLSPCRYEMHSKCRTTKKARTKRRKYLEIYSFYGLLSVRCCYS